MRVHFSMTITLACDFSSEPCCLHVHLLCSINARTHTHTHRMPEVERVQSTTEQLRREVGIERTKISVSAKE